MANPVQEKIQKSFASRLKAETELKMVQNVIVDAVDHSDHRARVVRLVESCEAAMTKAFASNEQLLELAKWSNDPTLTAADLEKWLGVVTAEKDEILKKARDYIDQYPEQDKPSQTDEFLLTTFCFVKQCLNARPLAPASTDATGSHRTISCWELPVLLYRHTFMPK